MADWSAMRGGNRNSTEGEDTATSQGTLLTSGDPAHTKGAYVEMDSSTPFDAQGFMLTMFNNTRHSCLLDVAIGAAASEQVILPNFLHAFDYTQPSSTYFPIPIPASSRIAMRTQAGFAAQTEFAQITLLAQGFLPGSPLGRIDDWGTVTASSRGTEVDPGAVMNTKGAYSQLVASTTFDVMAIVIVIGGGVAYYRPGGKWLIDIAMGAAASEQIFLPDLGFAAPTAGSFYGDIMPKTVGPLPVHIPAGTRIAARAQCATNDAGYRVFDIAIYGIG